MWIKRNLKFKLKKLSKFCLHFVLRHGTFKDDEKENKSTKFKKKIESNKIEKLTINKFLYIKRSSW